MKKGFIECKARFLYPMMKMRNYRRQYKFQGVQLSFKEERESAMSMVVEVGQGEGEYRDSLGEPRRRGKGLETLMP
jgi:hypothetical protein